MQTCHLIFENIKGEDRGGVLERIVNLNLQYMLQLSANGKVYIQSYVVMVYATLVSLPLYDSCYILPLYDKMAL